MVFGARAGLGAARLAEAEDSHADEAAILDQAAVARDRVGGLYRSTGGGESVAGLRREMNVTMEAGAGIYRTDESLRRSCAAMNDIRRRYADVELEDKSNVYNTDLIQALELGAMIDVAGAVIVAALKRRESRGSHQRLDHERRDDATYLKHSLAHYVSGDDPRIEYRDVVITRSEPGERVYGGEQK